MDALRKARALALLTPVVLLGGAYVSEYVFGLYPCEMCWWQRYAHFAALALSLLAFLPGLVRSMTALAGAAIATSAAIGLFHAGVEYHWWQGFTTCTSVSGSSGDPLADIFAMPIVRCDVAQWTLGGISLAGFNFLFSGAAAIATFLLMDRSRSETPT